VVKANAYGHGAVKAARAALDGGATRLAVSTLAEARELIGLVPAEHILVMGGLVPAQAGAAAASGCAIGLSSLAMAEAMTLADYGAAIARRQRNREAHARLAARYDAAITLAAPGAAPVGLGSTGNPVNEFMPSWCATPSARRITS